VDETLSRQLAGLEPAAQVRSVPAEPRPEIWFRRRLSFRTAVRDVWRSRELILTLAERDLRVRYKQAVLGFAWALFTPVMLMLVFSLVFTKFANVETGGVPYALFSFIGLIPWTFFSSSVTGGGMSLVTNMQIVNKVYCPREVFPIGAIAVALVDTLASVAVLGLLFGIEGYAPKTEIYYLPVFLPALFAFTTGVTLAVSVLLVYLRDLRHVLPMLVQFGLFATPVAYGLHVLANSTGRILLYSAVNPLVPVIDGLRRTVLLGTDPDWDSLAVGTASAFLVLAFGFWLFKRLQSGIADIA
jgi:ABC-2 type transport system permease protein/lipopolysaccharide transport system permease protein